MIEVGTPPVVVRPEVKREPQMLWNVIKECRAKVAGNERNDERDDEEDTRGDLVV